SKAIGSRCKTGLVFCLWDLVSTLQLKTKAWHFITGLQAITDSMTFAELGRTCWDLTLNRWRDLGGSSDGLRSRCGISSITPIVKEKYLTRTQSQFLSGL